MSSCSASGLVLLVAPLTSSVLAAAPDRYAGIASGINNAVARTGSLLAVSALPALVGIGGADYQQPERLRSGLRARPADLRRAALRGRRVAFVGLRDESRGGGHRLIRLST